MAPMSSKSAPENRNNSVACQGAASNQHFSFSIVIGHYNDCKWVFNEPSCTPWCHVVVHMNEHQWLTVSNIRSCGGGGGG